MIPLNYKEDTLYQISTLTWTVLLCWTSMSRLG